MRRSNEARLYRKSNNTAATLCYSGHLLIEHRNALIVDAELTTADGYAERATAIEMLARLPKRSGRRTVAGDKGYDTKGFVAEVRQLGFTPPHRATHQRSALRDRPTDHPTRRSRGGHAQTQTGRRPSDGSRPSPPDAIRITALDDLATT